MRTERVELERGGGEPLALALRVPAGDGGPRPALIALDCPPAWSAALDALGAPTALLSTSELEDADRSRLADLTRVLRYLQARADVDPERIAAVGWGGGGTLAFLFGCHADGLAAIADVGGALVLPELDQRRPMQPLEMALNLQAPFLAVLGADAPPGHADEVRRVLDQFAKPHAVSVLDARGPGFFDEGASGYDEGLARTALERTLGFLRAELGLGPS